MKKSNRKIWILAIAACVTVLFFGCDNAAGDPDTGSEISTDEHNDGTSAPLEEEKYNQALALITENKYDDAYKILEEIKNHSNAEELLKHFVFKPTTSLLNETDATRTVTEEFEYTYDSLGNCTKKKGTYNTIEYAYNANGLLKKQTHSNGSYIKVIEYFYDSTDALIKEVSTTSLGGELSDPEHTEYTYDTNSNLIKKVSDKVITQYIYDANENCIKEEYYFNDKVSQTNQYTYDSNGVLLKKEELELVFGDHFVTDYTYDATGQLIKEVMVYTSSFGGRSIKNVTYAYDANGNLLKKHSSLVTLEEGDGCLLPMDITEEYKDYKLYYISE